MAAGKWNLVLEQGVPYTARFRIAVAGVPMQLSGRAVHAQVRSKSGRDLLLNLAPYLRIEDEDEPGVIDLFIPARITRTLQRDGIWDLFVDDPGTQDSVGIRLLEGSVSIIRAVSHA